MRHVSDAGSQTSLAVLFRAIPELDPAYVALVAMLRVLDDGMSTRLHYQLCDQRGLAYSINAGIEPLADVALLDIAGATANAKVPELVARLLELAAEVSQSGIEEAELAKVKRRFRYDLLSSIDDANAMAGWFGGTALYYPPPSLEARISAMDAITPADVQRAARRILTPDNLTLVVVGALSRARVAEIKTSVTGFPFG